ncbi:ATP synthase mitochondrial F1 complex assembly factor 2 [Ophidiomyces ophidiicola]|nr:ATP synthase mitochondrial F1 complex assembly factor 2 [Ophidiomyces ophidiicola]
MKALQRSSSIWSRYSFVPIGFRDASRLRYVHHSVSNTAVAHPINVHGPPPKAPIPSPEFTERIERRKKQSALIRQDKNAGVARGDGKAGVLRRRFWKDVHVTEVPEGFQVSLDSRPIRTPTKNILIIPRSKPHLAHAIALEWDLLVSAQQALKQHLIPLTSLAARAEDIVQQDSRGDDTARNEIIRTLMRITTGGANTHGTAYNCIPVHEISQPQTTKEVIRGWIAGLPAYELAGLERAVLASKSLLVAVRLVVEWSEYFRHLQPDSERNFGIEKAAEVSSLEVRWQTEQWGEVEDTHDVEKEDLRRQLGSVILLVSGEQRP